MPGPNIPVQRIELYARRPTPANGGGGGGAGSGADGGEGGRGRGADGGASDAKTEQALAALEPGTLI